MWNPFEVYVQIHWEMRVTTVEEQHVTGELLLFKNIKIKKKPFKHDKTSSIPQRWASLNPSIHVCHVADHVLFLQSYLVFLQLLVQLLPTLA